jgi:hypothetical protein
MSDFFFNKLALFKFIIFNLKKKPNIKKKKNFKYNFSRI